MMTEVMRTAMKRTTALITFFASFARVIGPGRLHRSVGRLQGLVSPDQPLILCIVRSGPMMVRDSAVTKRSCTNRSLRCIMRPRWRTFSLDLERAKRLKGILQAFFRLFYGEMNGWLKPDTIYIARSVSGSVWHVILRGIMSPRWRSFERTE